MIPDHYKTLELQSVATKAEIKSAYRRLALIFHPDKNKSSNAHEKFISINEAYLILYDDQARIKYDREYKIIYGQPIINQEPENEQQESKKREQPWEEASQFEDEDLNQWTRNARQQAEGFAKMAFEEFTKLVFGMVKETGFQLGNAVLIMLGVLLLMSGCGNVVMGIFSKGEYGNPMIGIILLPIGIFLYSLAQNNYDKH